MRLSTNDPSSFSEPENGAIIHISLDWKIDFLNKIIKGTATYNYKLLKPNITQIFLDVKDIKVLKVYLIAYNKEIPTNFVITDEVPDIGSKLTIEIPAESNCSLKFRIVYETLSCASGLQWLNAEQTLGKVHPFLFSQCQAINARTVVPCQDTPSVKFSYDAIIEHPVELKALMSAIKLEDKLGISKFKQKVPIPSYLLAIAVGDVVYRNLGPKSRVWAEAGIVEKCAEEFSETQKMLECAICLCGPYVWDQYDLLVMPPSFPFGGMENPCLTFVTPTLLAGDKSLASVIAHEIAHSWTGNLVTNKNFEHFWLNEGFTVFIEHKIEGKLKGSRYRDFLAKQGLTQLLDNIKGQLAETPELTKLVLDLTNYSPDDAFSSVPYEKGSIFLRYLEDMFGGPEVFEDFCKSYLQKYKYQSIATDDFKKAFIEFYLQSDYASKLDLIDWDMWFYSEGMPPIIPELDDYFSKICEQLANIWASKTTEEIKNMKNLEENVSSLQIIDVLSKLIEKENIVDLGVDKINLLESIFNINMTKNSEIQFRFIRLCIRGRILNRLDEIIKFLNSNFRMKFVRPIYRDLGNWPEARNIAIENFYKVKDQMMKVCSNMVMKDLNLK